MEAKKIPVIEIFGPVIQGEGEMAGHWTHFLRTGGCDYKCSWCDTMYAVDPKQVKVNSIYMREVDIAVKFEQMARDSGCKTLTISGGNPAMWDMTSLVGTLKQQEWKVVVETQGSLWQNWFHYLDLVTISPKPPSSGMLCDLDRLESILYKLSNPVCIKIVAFDEADLNWAKFIFKKYKDRPRTTFYLQPGTDQYVDMQMANPGIYSKEEQEDRMKLRLLYRTRELTEELTKDPNLSHVRILPQIHSLVYGWARGV